MDNLTTDAVLEALTANTAAVTRLEKSVAAHQDWHRRAHKTALSVFGLGSGIILTTLGWGATQWRSGVESAMRDQSRAIAVSEVRDARSEHAELRSRDQSLAEELVKLGRDLQRIAQLPLKQDPDKVTR